MTSNSSSKSKVLVIFILLSFYVITPLTAGCGWLLSTKHWYLALWAPVLPASHPLGFLDYVFMGVPCVLLSLLVSIPLTEWIGRISN
jgi:hypothetical protein